MVSVSFFLLFLRFRDSFQKCSISGHLKFGKRMRVRISGLFGSKLPGRLLRSVDLNSNHLDMTEIPKPVRFEVFFAADVTRIYWYR